MSELMLPLWLGHRLVEENLALRLHPRFRLDTPVCLIVGMPDKWASP
jgi:hypothetical protein